MSSVTVPEEAANHLGGILLAFNREIFGSLLDEAQQLAHEGQANAAVLIAGTILEYLERSPASQLMPPQHRGEVETWRQLRNKAAHGASATAEQAKALVDGIRALLMSHEPESCTDAAELARSIKGKYAHLPTSADDFIRRKREDLDLEDRR